MLAEFYAHEATWYRMFGLFSQLYFLGCISNRNGKIGVVVEQSPFTIPCLSLSRKTFSIMVFMEV